MLNPAIIAIVAGTLMVSAYAAFAASFGLRIIRGWDLNSGSEHQMVLERKTYLISTTMAYLFGLVLFTTFLFVFTGDHLHRLFVGAMCAAGTFNVNAYGYPLLMIKVLNFSLCGLWLILNHLDGQAYDYPLIRTKYRFLIAIAVLLGLDSWLTLKYFGALRADVITSCCGTLFSQDTQAISGDLAALPSYGTKVLLFLGIAIHLRSGIHLWTTGRGARVFGILSAGLLLFGIAAVIGVISVYYYELPTHHCPFCLLQSDYGFIGYPLYLSLFMGGIAGAGVGLTGRYRNVVSLQSTVPRLQKRLCLFSVLGYVCFAAIAAFPMLFSDFRLEGY
ncbi:MAG: hypothetical protein C4519_09405 [Desulfobacteraceae bacterium]|nr:MAG: hypothetical protein C4519_09405 [Desulfobacteraceae bacterium]